MRLTVLLFMLAITLVGAYNMIVTRQEIEAIRDEMFAQANVHYLVLREWEGYRIKVTNDGTCLCK